jgi:carboxyl-terminal processing protease
VPAFAAVTQELQRRGLDRPTATLPALNGRCDPGVAKAVDLF